MSLNVLARNPPTSPLAGMRILLVEDDIDLLDALAEHLAGAGAIVVRASSARGARAALVDADYDLLVSDLGLPDGTGCEIALAARDDMRVCAALALSGERGDDALDASRAAGFQVHITKPFNPGMLVHVAEILLRRSL